MNNAGVNVGKNRVPIHEFSDADWHHIIRVDLDGVFFCSRAVSARMVSRRKGSIINITSVFGMVPARLQCAYTAAKAGVANFTRSHALELGQYGIRVNGIATGSILTEGTKSIFYSPENKQKADSLVSHIPLGAPGENRGHRRCGALPRFRRCQVCHRPHPGRRWRLDRGLPPRLVKFGMTTRQE